MIETVSMLRRGAVSRLRIDESATRARVSTLTDDVRRGLLALQKTLPPKYFYDAHGAQLFDAICDVPEYYLTRTEQTLLERVVDEIVAVTRPSDVVEFGSGASRKTRIVLDALVRQRNDLRYVPIDVSEAMLRRAALALLHDYPSLHVHAVVADYEYDLALLPPGQRRLVLFLGSTIGNCTPVQTLRFLRNVRRQLTTSDYFLLGVDLVKPTEILEAAYNDRAGITEEFNRNILRVINRELGADFVLERFDHVAFFNREAAQIEMHLRANRAHSVSISALDLSVPFVAGETIHTEISRKFTKNEVEAVLRATGFQPLRWDTPEDNSFALALARAA